MKKRTGAVASDQNYNRAKSMLETRLANVPDSHREEATTEHYAFDFLVAELFETTEEGFFWFTDGAGDKGVDFYVRRDDEYAVYQCKMPELETLKHQQPPVTYDATAVAELRDTICYLLNRGTPSEGSQRITELRTHLHEDLSLDPEKVSIRFNLAVFGALTKDAGEAFKRLRSEYHDKHGVLIRLLDWSNIHDELLAPTAEANTPKRMTLKVRHGELLVRDEWAYLLAPAFDLVEAFKRNHFALFDLNVRHELRSSPVNAAIIRSLMTRSSQKRFHLLNNGVTVTCAKFTPSSVNQKMTHVTVERPQIINGCQTVLSLYRAYYEHNMSPDLQADFRENCKVQVRAISEVNDDLVGQLVISTNNQNPMTARNLKSNDGVQKKLKRDFEALPHRWFYQRKEGESKSLWEFPPAGFDPSLFEDEHGKQRVADNEEVAQAWYAFMGFSSLTSERRKELFNDSQPHYERIFKLAPSTSLWGHMSNWNKVCEFQRDDFTASTPPAVLLILSYITSQFVRKNTPSTSANRTEAMKRLGLAGKRLPPRELDALLAKDSDFAVNQMMGLMEDVVSELFATVFVWRYGALDETTAAGILRTPEYASLLQSPDFAATARALAEGKGLRPGNLLYSIYEFIRFGVTQFLVTYRSDYNLADRKIRYLHRDDTILNLKRVLHDLDEESAVLVKKWKDVDRSFLQSLPELPLICAGSQGDH